HQQEHLRPARWRRLPDEVDHLAVRTPVDESAGVVPLAPPLGAVADELPADLPVVVAEDLAGEVGEVALGALLVRQGAVDDRERHARRLLPPSSSTSTTR